MQSILYIVGNTPRAHASSRDALSIIYILLVNRGYQWRGGLFPMRKSNSLLDCRNFYNTVCVSMSIYMYRADNCIPHYIVENIL